MRSTFSGCEVVRASQPRVLCPEPVNPDVSRVERHRLAPEMRWRRMRAVKVARLNARRAAAHTVDGCFRVSHARSQEHRGRGNEQLVSLYELDRVRASLHRKENFQ